MIRAKRLSPEPIIRPHMDERMGANINGPSLIRVPDWIEAPLGRYYLYFADHKGAYIRLACADRLAGPWRMHTPGTLTLAASHFATERPDPAAISEGTRREAAGSSEQDYLHPHIASPDVQVDRDRREIRMYYHGMLEDGEQRTRVAVSTDGIAFEARPEILGNSYFRVFRHRGWHYALVMPGELRRSYDGLTGFESGPVLFCPEMRHAAVRCTGDALDVFWSRVGDAPERILHSRVRLDGEWTEWGEEGARVGRLRPERRAVGARRDQPPGAPASGSVRVRGVRQDVSAVLRRRRVRHRNRGGHGARLSRSPSARMCNNRRPPASRMIRGGPSVAKRSSRSEPVYTRTPIEAERGVCAGGHPAVADAGIRLMQEGGNAFDALVGAAFGSLVHVPGLGIVLNNAMESVVPSRTTDGAQSRKSRMPRKSEIVPAGCAAVARSTSRASIPAARAPS